MFDNVNECIEYVKKQSILFYSIANNKQKLYEEINKLKESSDLNKLLEFYKNHIGPLNILRLVVLEKLKEGILITEDIVREIKDKFNNKDLEYFKKYVTQDILDSVANHKTTKGEDPFKSWKDSFRIFYVYFFNLKKEQIDYCLKKIGKKLIEDLNLTNYEIQLVNFDGVQHQGLDRCSLCLFPKELEEYKYAFQFSLDITNNQLFAGTYKGKEVTNKNFENNRNECFDYSTILQTLKQYSSQIIDLNNSLIESKKQKQSLFEKEKQDTKGLDNGEKINNKSKLPLNQILYGPPGTGKTYNTVIKAMEIIDSPNKYDNIDDTKYKELKDRFNKLKESGQIEFITFHQSYSYEEFIEGIKPYIPKDNWINSNETSNDDLDEVKYIGKNGIFKNICENAKKLILKNVKLNLKEDPKIWKVSLEHTGDNETRKECMQNNHIRIGWDDYGEVITDETIFRNGGKNVLNAFINKMEKGDIVLSCYSEKTIDAIGIIEGDYEWHDKYPEYKRLRKVNWLIKGLNHNILDINKGIKFTLGTVYQLNNISLKDILDIINSNKKKIVDYEINNKPYVIIIDEINRGNISKIFGELITLIEEDKREQMSVKLPYSQDFFTVPKNLYIIGTMNTSDRSIASVDIALRRRFKFIEMMPQKNLVADFDIEFNKVFENLNNKIRILLDRDHQIGHSYFINTKYNDENGNNNIETLKNIWFDEILPLLNEYFYNDWDKLNLIVPGFITEVNVPKSLQNEYDKSYEFKTIDDFKDNNDFKNALLKILE